MYEFWYSIWNFLHMNKFFIILILIFNSLEINSQQLYTSDGTTTFDGSKESFEPIKAINNSSASIIDDEGNIAALIYIKDFEFRLGLMQEHFNENYMFSDKYPKSTFQGYIENFNYYKLENNFTNFKILGKIEIKGVKKDISTLAKIKKTDTGIYMKASFNVKLTDFNIKVPKLVFKKIDENIDINLSYNYEKK